MTYRRIALVALGAFAIVVVVLSIVPHKWHGNVTTPVGPASGAVFQCPSAWASGSITNIGRPVVVPASLSGRVVDASNQETPANPAYPVAGTPCGERAGLRVATVIDVALVAVAGGVLLTRRRRAYVAA